MYFARWWVNRFIACFVQVQHTGTKLWMRCILMGFEVDRSTLGQVFLHIFGFSAVNITPPVLHAHSFISRRRCIISAIDRVVKKNAVKDTSMSSSWKLH